MACLLVIDGPATGTHFALRTYKLVDVGRDEECTFQIIDPLISRHHLQIRAADDVHHTAADCGSANGVHVNGNRIGKETPLKNGDEIAIGSSKIIYSTTDYPDAQSAMIGIRPGRQWKATTIMRE